jgi:uncharacterized membrane protein YbhN (UPF0104 family)
MRPQTNKILGYLLVAVSLFIIPYFLLDSDELVSALLAVRVESIVLLSPLVLLSLFFNGVKIFLLQSLFQKKIPLGESVALASANALWNYLPFTGGLVVRGAYLKRKHDFPWSRFLATIVASYLISFFAFGLFGLFVSLLLVPQQKFIFSLFFLGMILFPWLALQVSSAVQDKINLLRPLQAAIPQMKELLAKRRILAALLGLDLVTLLVDSVRIYLVSNVAGEKISFATALLITPVTILASLLNITPGALVIREALITFTTNQLNYSVQTGVVIASVDRLVVVLGIFLAGAISILYLKRKLDQP